ncbi:hypothetical protein [Enterococcus ratti]|uniref:Uncharacterized protein n=1 Tax=Enterococcus ratti TaxID=150033 RepID=A0A1L8WR59_9ENTE|nr:hypothetical protein [Enterococcus ratti]OJG83475.1 hypothetical protein RV14_GL001353 [Enterococcus ratti]
MPLNKREKEMIKYFVKYELTFTVQELARFARVSTKKVYCTIKKSRAIRKKKHEFTLFVV